MTENEFGLPLAQATLNEHCREVQIEIRHPVMNGPFAASFVAAIATTAEQQSLLRSE